MFGGLADVGLVGLGEKSTGDSKPNQPVGIYSERDLEFAVGTEILR